MAIKLLKALKKEVSIKNMIHSRLAGWEKPRSHAKIHASDLMKDGEYCPRELALLDLGLGKKKDSYVGTALRITFDHGRDIEHRIRNDWLRDAAVGKWKCAVCGNHHATFGKVPKVACKCGYNKWEYDEYRFMDEQSGTSCGVDVMLDVGEPKLRIVEIKTIDKDEWKKLVAPMAEHKFRTSLYLRLAHASTDEVSQRVNTNVATLLYISKSYGSKDESLKASGIPDSPFSPFKEFTIHRDDSLSDVPLAKAEVATAWRQDRSKGMPAGVCHSALIGRAQKCPCAVACFSGKHPQVVTWMENGTKRHPDKPLLSEL